jgi:ABC-type molybdenum transport system ATPase subunit/photorepair protein PhrA
MASCTGCRPGHTGRRSPSRYDLAVAAPTDPADSGIVFRAAGVDLVRDDRLLLAQVSVTIRSGEHWALLGLNGAGKSTLLQIMATSATRWR